jgi:hypothetical protein
MMLNNLCHTNFHVEPIKHIVGESNATAYYISITPGNAMGKLGKVVDNVASKASNESIFETVSTQSADKKSGSWVKRALSALRF